MSELADKVASGDLTADMSLLLERVANDEVGQLARSFYTMTKNLRYMIEQLKESAQELNNASQRLNGASVSASEIMQMIHESIEEISLRMDTVSVATRKIAASSEEMAASMHQLNNRAENGNNLAKEIEQRVKIQGFDNANQLVKFTDETIIRDYDQFKDISDQYSHHVKGFFKLTEEFSHMCNQVLKTVGEVNLAIESVAVTLAENASSAQEITRGTEYTVKSVMEISDAANDLSQMAEKHNKIVNQFKIS